MLEKIVENTCEGAYPGWYVSPLTSSPFSFVANKFVKRRLTKALAIAAVTPSLVSLGRSDPEECLG